MQNKSILLIIGGGIAAYKSLELIRELARRNINTRAILTKAGAEFITPLSVASLTGQPCHTDLFDLTSETEMGHIELSRSADLVVVAPATADLMAKAANGLANDLASTTLLATDKPVMFAPAMNVRMWEHAATQRNLNTLQKDGALITGPDKGEMACGEFGPGRLAEPIDIANEIDAYFTKSASGTLTGKHILITAGPTHEPLDPVRYLANRSSGKQGYALAEALRNLGADVTLVTGPTSIPHPAGMKIIEIESAREMMAASENALPADCTIFCAAVADYRPTIETDHKIKKERGGLTSIAVAENPDILKTISQLKTNRPQLVIGFAAETDDVLCNAEAKLKRKGCDWIIANDVTPGENGVMGGSRNTITLLSKNGEDAWPEMSKTDVAHRLAERISKALTGPTLVKAAE